MSMDRIHKEWQHAARDAGLRGCEFKVRHDGDGRVLAMGVGIQGMNPTNVEHVAEVEVGAGVDPASLIPALIAEIKEQQGAE